MTPNFQHTGVYGKFQYNGYSAGSKGGPTFFAWLPYAMCCIRLS